MFYENAPNANLSRATLAFLTRRASTSERWSRQATGAAELAPVSLISRYFRRGAWAIAAAPLRCLWQNFRAEGAIGGGSLWSHADQDPLARRQERDGWSS